MSAREPVFNVPRSVTITLIACAAVYTWLAWTESLEAFFALAFVPARYLEGGADFYPGGEIARVTSFVTYAFLHGNLTHLAINCVWMLPFGSAVASRVGPARFALFFAACAAAAAATHLLFHFGSEAPVVGASGAISGLMAAAMRFLFSPDRRSGGFDLSATRAATLRELARDPRMIFFLVIWIGLNVLFGLGIVSFPGADGAIAWEAHVGGFLYGLLFFGLFDRPIPQSPEPPPPLH
jgi:membrane associated rhomboid family serine protease